MSGQEGRLCEPTSGSMSMSIAVSRPAFEILTLFILGSCLGCWTVPFAGWSWLGILYGESQVLSGSTILKSLDDKYHCRNFGDIIRDFRRTCFPLPEFSDSLAGLDTFMDMKNDRLECASNLFYWQSCGHPAKFDVQSNSIPNAVSHSIRTCKHNYSCHLI